MGKRFLTHTIDVQKLAYLVCIAVHVLYFLSDPNQTYLLRSSLFQVQFQAFRLFAEVALVPGLVCIAFVELIKHRFGIVKAFVSVFGLILCNVVSGGQPDFNLLSLYWLVVACPTSVADTDIIGTVFVAGTLGSLITIALALCGDIPNMIKYWHGVLRYGLGFFRDFYCAADLTVLVSAWVYWNLRKWKLYKYAVALSAGIIVYAIANVRAVFVILLVQLIGIALWRATIVHDRMHLWLFRLVRMSAALLPLLFTGLSLFLGVYVDGAKASSNSSYGILKELLAVRVAPWNNGIEEVGLSFFGGSGKPTDTFDSTYLTVSVTYGMVFAILIALLCVYCWLRLVSKDHYYIVLFATSMSVLGFTMRFVDVPAFNYSILFLATLIARDVKNRPVPSLSTIGSRLALGLAARRNKLLAVAAVTGAVAVVLIAANVVGLAGKPHSVSAGYAHTTASFPDGTVEAVGRNDYGQCNVGRWRGITAASAGHLHTVGLCVDGTVVARGNNYYGQCDVGDWDDIVEISAGYQHTVGLRSDGSVVAVGSTKNGRCDVDEWRDVVAVAAGGAHTVGLRSDGTVVATGRNDDGRCNVKDWDDVVAIDTSYRHVVALRSDGRVYAAGNNEYGQCDVDDWTDIVAISAGYNHTVGIHSDGTVIATGSREYDECDVNGWANITAVAAGGRHTVAVKNDDTFEACGSNRAGQCEIRYDRILKPYTASIDRAN